MSERVARETQGMTVLRVFNNNVVLARDSSGDEVILTGRGLGFQAKAGTAVDPAKIIRVFVPSDGRDPDHLAQLLAGVPPEMIQLVSRTLPDLADSDRMTHSATLVIALADHLNFATHRAARGLTVEYPLRAEVSHLYPHELRQARDLLAAVNLHLEQPLPESEEVALALHLVNAGMASGDHTFTYRMTGVIHQLVSVIEAEYGLDLGHDSVSVGRFITHLRYLFVRVSQHQQLASESSPISDAIRATYPDATIVAERLAGIIELRLGDELTSDEVSYLSLHVARIAESR
jgi:beta-glucoside operon transcriptional antiterminator